MTRHTLPGTSTQDLLAGPTSRPRRGVYELILAAVVVVGLALGVLCAAEVEQTPPPAASHSADYANAAATVVFVSQALQSPEPDFGR